MYNLIKYGILVFKSIITTSTNQLKTLLVITFRSNANDLVNQKRQFAMIFLHRDTFFSEQKNECQLYGSNVVSQIS